MNRFGQLNSDLRLVGASLEGGLSSMDRTEMMILIW